MSRVLRAYSSVFTGKKLSNFELRMLCGVLVHNKSFDQPLKLSEFVKPVPERRFKLGKKPQEPVIKLAKQEHVDAFFKTGLLQFGSFAYYNSFGHPEIGDVEEGMVTLIAKTPSGIYGGKYASGFNHRVFCTYLGTIDRITMTKFGYNAGFVITHPVEFANSVAESVKASSVTFGKCLYRPHKAVLGFPGNNVERHVFSNRSGDIVSVGKYFIKQDHYSHQREYRFLWELPEDVSGAEVFDCSLARQFCKPLVLS